MNIISIKRTALFVILILNCVFTKAQEFSIRPVADYKMPVQRKQERQIYQDVVKLYSQLEQVSTISFTALPKQQIKPGLQQDIDNKFKYLEVIQIKPELICNYVKQNHPTALSLELPYKDTIVVIDLVEVELFNADFRLLADDMDKVKDVKLGHYFQGIVRGERSFATLNVFENEVNGVFHNEAGDLRLEFGKIKVAGEPNTYALYNLSDVKNPADINCSTDIGSMSEDLMLKHQHADDYKDERSFNCFTNFWDIAYDLYSFYGNNAQNVTNYVTSVYNNFKLLYSNEQLGTSLNTIYIWTSQDPWVSINNSTSQNLNNYSAGRTGFGTNLACLFSSYTNGGIAWLNTVCQAGEYYRHSFCGYMGGNVPNFPSYYWDVEVATHEVGHNLGSNHTHACVWAGGQAIDNCVATGCGGVLPAYGAGTIMSYCHQNPNVGIGFAYGFGPQPGNLIRNISACYAGQQCNPSGGVITFCAPVTNLQVSYITFISANLNWTHSASYTNYYVMIKPSNAANFVNVSGNITGNNFTLSNLIPNTTYNVRVYTNCQNGALYYSSVSFTTPNQVCNAAYDVVANNAIAGAAVIPYNTNLNGFIDNLSDIDFYKFTRNSNKPISISLEDYGSNYDIRLYKSNGMVVANSQTIGNTKIISYTGLPGTYLVKVFGKTLNAFNANVCYQLRVNYSGNLDAEELKPESCNVYPNPVSAKLNLELLSNQEGNAARVLLRNILGGTVRDLDFDLNIGVNVREIDLNNLPPGLYTIQIFTESGINFNHKILKQ